MLISINSMPSSIPIPPENDHNTLKQCQVEGYQNILKLSCRPDAFTSYETFKENEKEDRY